MGILKRAVSYLSLALVAVFVFGSAFAQAQTITQGYDIETNVNLQRGMIVALKENDPKNYRRKK